MSLKTNAAHDNSCKVTPTVVIYGTLTVGQDIRHWNPIDSDVNDKSPKCTRCHNLQIFPVLYASI